MVIMGLTITPKQLNILFINRNDVYSVQQPNGGYYIVKNKIDANIIKQHLAGEITIGIYCLDTENNIKWGCIDLDGTDLTLLRRESEIIYNTFKPFPRMLEFSGRRGYHVWLFFNPKITASFGKQLIKSRLTRINQNHHEIFPKQVTLDSTRKYGNLVKLPCGIHLKSGKRSEIIKYDNLEEIF